jgi:ABC-type amino acid transport substrate-binding protein
LRLPGTTTELNVADYFRANGMKMKPVVIENTPELAKAFFAGRCDCLTSDASQLASTRAVAPNPDDYIILPEIISKRTPGSGGSPRRRPVVRYRQFRVLAMIKPKNWALPPRT